MSIDNFAKNYAGANGYPYYNFYNKHLPPSGDVYYDETNTSWSWAAPEYQKEAPIFEKPWPTGYWNGYFDYLDQEQKSPYPLTVRRGGMNEQQAWNIQTTVYRTPDLSLGTKSRDAFFSNIAQEALARSPNIPSCQW
jgi:hypothetical protein